MDIRKVGSRWTATAKGQINGIDYCFFAQSSSLKKAAGEVLAAYANFKRQVRAFE